MYDKIEEECPSPPEPALVAALAALEAHLLGEPPPKEEHDASDP